LERNTIACAESWADELLSRASRVRQLIGDAHWLSDGFQKEDIVREFLRRHLPQSLRISRGFVCPTDAGSAVSPEVDILITDTESELPWLVEGGLAIVPPSSVVAQIHVKTTFKAENVLDVFRSSHAVYRSCEKHKALDTIWSCGVFFEPAFDGVAERYVEHFENCVSRFLAENATDRLARHLPDCIAVINGPVLLTSKDALKGDPKGTVTMRLFDCGKLSIAVLLTNLYDSIQRRGRDLTRRGEWVQVVQSEDIKLVKEIKVAAG
jgi:hypothetical protein